MPKGRINNPCLGSAKAPKKITHEPGLKFTGYGLCNVCGHNVALTRKGNLMAHKNRRIENGQVPSL